MNSAEITEALRTLARTKMRFITAADLCGILKLSEEECLDLLEEFVQQGLLRTTQSHKGEPYFWLTPQLAQE